jgi:hypothetical protein
MQEYDDGKSKSRAENVQELARAAPKFQAFSTGKNRKKGDFAGDIALNI